VGDKLSDVLLDEVGVDMARFYETLLTRLLVMQGNSCDKKGCNAPCLQAGK
jgi:hypothetical protein